MPYACFWTGLSQLALSPNLFYYVHDILRWHVEAGWILHVPSRKASFQDGKWKSKNRKQLMIDESAL